MTVHSAQYAVVKPNNNSVPTYASRYRETVYFAFWSEIYVSEIKIHTSENNLFEIRKYFKLTKLFE
jgi:hypothetical protein